MIGILSDAHGNRSGFQSAIAHLRNLGATKFYFLGDAVGYIPSISVVQDLLQMGVEIKCILGNHEMMLLEKNGCTQKEQVYQHQLVRNNITCGQLNFLRSWPTHRREIINKTSVLFVHGSPNDFTNEYVYPDTDLRQFDPVASIVFMGHSHHPFIRACNGTTFVNVGSCGLPRDDGRYGAACLYDPISRDFKVIRFGIYEETKAFLTTYPAVNKSVYNLLERRSISVFGDLL